MIDMGFEEDVRTIFSYFKVYSRHPSKSSNNSFLLSLPETSTINILFILVPKTDVIVQCDDAEENPKFRQKCFGKTWLVELDEFYQFA